MKILAVLTDIWICSTAQYSIVLRVDCWPLSGVLSKSLGMLVLVLLWVDIVLVELLEERATRGVDGDRCDSPKPPYAPS